MENISVSVRVRPLNRLEVQEFFAWKIEGNSIVQLDPTTRDVDRTRDTKYGLDHVFGPEWSTQQIYETTTRGIIHKVVNGFNGTVFAYGQTSSGKTHTMLGDSEDPSKAGIIPLAVAEAFRMIESNNLREYLIRVSYMELYNEEVNDLLNHGNVKLPIHESKENGPYVCGLYEEIVTGPEQVMALLKKGNDNRHTGATKMNERSSRSHTIFRMVVESRAVDTEGDGAGAVLVSALTLVDLAGSERLAKTGAEGIRAKECTHINKSLLTLGTVINKLSEGVLAAGGHIPYRDSKLTRILQPSLGGNAKTAIICAMTPAWCHVEESHSTLRFACRAKSIVNNAVVNEVLSDAAVLKRQAKEIEDLKRRLAENGSSAEVSDEINSLRAKLLRLEQREEYLRLELQEQQELYAKAQKQAEVAKKIMFEKNREEPVEGTSRKHNRRETWCPGKSAWAAPAILAAADTPTHSGGGDAIQRKRGLERHDGGMPAKSNAELSALVEEDEEEGDVVEGPTPQRRRRERSFALDELPEEEEEEEDEEDEQQKQAASHPELNRIMAALPSQERVALNALVQNWMGVEERLAATQEELLVAQQAAMQHEETARSALQQKDAMAQQLEQAKWQSRQLDKKVEELTAACRAAEQEREELVASQTQFQEEAAAKYDELHTRHKEVQEAHADLKEKLKAMKAELSDARGRLQLRDSEAGMREAKLVEHAQEVAEISAKLKEKVEELEATRRNAQAAEERTAEMEGRVRELYECNKRLELHVTELESRKRAPLYQKKQEEELKAAVEKAQECEVRAVEAELRAKEARTELEAAQKKLTELQEEMDAKARQAARSQEELAERHSLEVQRLNVESGLQQERHEEALAGMKAAAQELEAAKAALERNLEAREQRISELQQEIKTLQSRIAELEASEAELLACSTAASEKITLLEHTAEEENAAHEAALASAQRSHEEAMAAAVAAHEQAVAALQAAMEEAKASNATAVKQLEEELRGAHDRADELVKSSLDQSQQAEATRLDLQRQVNELAAKVQEAAGALKAKEELKEERQRSKQEIASLKSELQKLQLESKTGAKGKDIAQKEIESLKKRLTDTETKLRAALQDKAAAVQEKGNLERQLKQNLTQKAMIEKTLEKKDAVENKKRESIMVNLNKTKEQVNSYEERLQRAHTELQKIQMDLMAKQSECGSLEEQLKHQQEENAQLREESSKLSAEVDDLRKETGELSTQLAESNCKLEFATENLESAKTEAQQLAADLDRVQSELAAARSDVQQRDLTVEALRGDLERAATQHGLVLGQLERLQSENAGAQQQLEQLLAEGDQLRTTMAELRTALDAAHVATAAAEEARATTQEAARQARQEASELRSALSAMEEQGRLLSANYAASQEGLASAQTHLTEAVAARESLQGQLHMAEATCAALRLQLQQDASSHEQLLGQLSFAEAEAKQLASKLSAAEAAVKQRDGCLEQASTEMHRLASSLSAAELEVQQLSSKLAASQAETQGLAAKVAAAELEIEQSRSQLVDAAAETQRLSEKLAATEFELRRLESLSASFNAASAGQDEAVQRLAGDLATASAEAQQLRERQAEQQHAAAAAARQAAQELADAKAETEGLRDQLAALKQAAAAYDEEAASKLAALEAEVQRLQVQLDHALQEASGYRAQVADAAEQIHALSTHVSSLEAQLSAAPALHHNGQQVAGEQDDTVDLLSSPAPHACKPAAQSLPDGLRESLERLLDESAAEIAELKAALGASEQRAESLREELVAARAQVVEVQSVASALNVTADITRSLSAAGGSRRQQQMTELVQHVDRLTQENNDLKFEMDEVRMNSALEQKQLRALADAAHAELSQQRQQIEVLQDRCASLAADLDAAREASASAQQASNQAEGDARGSDEQNREAASCITALQARVAEVEMERNALQARLSEALAAMDGLAHDLALMASERERLQGVVEELTAQAASGAHLQAKLDGYKDKLRLAAQDAEQLAAARNAYLELQGTVDGQAAKLRELATLQLRYEQLQQQYAGLQEQHAVVQRQLSGVHNDHGTAAGTAEADSEVDGLRSRVAELLERQRALESEMSDLQAACNVIHAEKETLRQAMDRRVLELEIANIGLQDELKKLRGEEPGNTTAASASSSTALKIDALLAERDRLQAQVQDLLLALDNAAVAKEQACARLEAELQDRRAASVGMEAIVASLQQTQQALESEKAGMQEKISMLHEALSAAASARATADGDAIQRATEVEAALSFLQLRFDELLGKHEELQREAADKAADADALRAGMARELEKRKEAERRGEELAGAVEELHGQLLHAQQTANDLASSRSEACQRLAVSENAQGQVQQLELQVSSLQATVKRLESDLTAAKAAAAEAESEAEGLLDQNTVLESQNRDLRESHAALQARVAFVTGQAEEAAARLLDSEAVRSRLQTQVQELTEQVNVANEQRDASKHELAQLHGAVAAAAGDRSRLEMELVNLDKAYKELREENCRLEDALQAAQAKLLAAATSVDHAAREQLSELQSQLQLQESRHRAAMEQRQLELTALQERLAHDQRGFAEREADLQQRLAALEGELERVRDAQGEAIDELELSAKQREAELNAEKLSLQSQIHWLQEENQRLQQQGPSAPAQAVPSHVAEQLAALESELRRAKRGEMKLQAMMYRIRKDVEAANGDLAAYDKLVDTRSLQYDVDLWTQKYKRVAREAEQIELEKRRLQALVEKQEQQLSTLMQAGGSKAPIQPAASSMGVFVDKENMPYR